MTGVECTCPHGTGVSTNHAWSCPVMVATLAESGARRDAAPRCEHGNTIVGGCGECSELLMAEMQEEEAMRREGNAPLPPPRRR